MKRLVLPALLLLTTFHALAQGPYQQQANGSPAEKAELTKNEKAQVAAKAAFAKNPKDMQAKQAYVKATVRLGTNCMMSNILDRKVKYRRALSYYREALKLDPTNREAKNNKDMIEKIYKSMNRPIPKD